MPPPLAHEETEHEVLQRGLDHLRALLGESWEVVPIEFSGEIGADQVAHEGDPGFDLMIMIRNKAGHGIQSEILVEAKQRLSPKAAREVLAPHLATMQRLRGQSAGLVIAPWLSPRAREVLDKRGCGYLDFTGNVSLRLNRAGLIIRTDGAQRDPLGPASQGRSLRGTAAGRLVRLLVDVKPPFRPGDLAHYSGLSPAYVSRLIEVAEQQALLTREKRSIRDVDWAGLLRARAETTTLLPPQSSHAPTSWIAGLPRQGLEATLVRLRDIDAQHPGTVAVTGSHAAVAVAPLAIGGSLMTYVDPGVDLEVIAKRLGLLRAFGADATEGAVFVLHANDPVVLWSRRRVDDVPHVALSQLAIDCLSGPGRLPAEGEAVLDYMARHEDEWRLNDLGELSGPLPQRGL